MKKFLTTLFYYLNLSWVRGILFFDTSRDIKGRENVPRKGPLIVVSNHLNNADSPILTAAVPRQVSWLTKAEWFHTPGIGWMFGAGGMIPVRRAEADLHALRAAQERLKEGGCLGMFPEGHRSKDGVMHEAEPGTALIALRTGAPIQPVAIWGTEGVRLPKDMVTKRTRAYVRFGKPFTLPRPQRIAREDVEQATQTIMRAIAALLPEQYRGVYADNAAPETRKVGTGTD
ncbi:MAG: lysophospholipid acyltransferase family protein [Chloroflexota bacterium]